MEHDIPFGNSNRENGPTFLDFPLFLGIFQWDEPTKRVPFTTEPEIPEILTKWKAPLVSRVTVFSMVRDNQSMRERSWLGNPPMKGKGVNFFFLTQTLAKSGRFDQ